MTIQSICFKVSFNKYAIFPGVEALIADIKQHELNSCKHHFTFTQVYTVLLKLNFLPFFNKLCNFQRQLAQRRSVPLLHTLLPSPSSSSSQAFKLCLSPSFSFKSLTYSPLNGVSYNTTTNLVHPPVLPPLPLRVIIGSYIKPA